MSDLPKLAVYTIVRGGRPDLTNRSLGMLRRWAGVEYDHYVASNGADRKTNKIVSDLKHKGHVKCFHKHDRNWGQNLAANWLLDEIENVEDGEREGEKYDLILRWDDDAIPRSRRFLKKLIRIAHKAAEGCGYWSVWSPRITKLKHPPEALTLPGDDLGEPYEIVPMLGGICRLHPRAFFDGWRFNKLGSLGFGEAAEVAERCRQAEIAMARLLSISVEHAYGEDGQKERYPHLFTWEAKEAGRYLGYGL